jgi:PilZ domain-containing protein
MADEDLDKTLTDDRREHDRSRLILDVHFDGADATGVASTRDISVGGLFMKTQAEIPVGKTLSLRIPLGGQYAVLKAEVVYSKPGLGVGVRFIDLPDEARDLMVRELPQP